MRARRFSLTALFTAALAGVACDGRISGFGGSDFAGPQGDPGRVTLHRLNRAEYNNTVRDLLGTSQRPADDFPADDYGSGFDNIADVLTLSPLQLDLYQRSAGRLAAEVAAPPLGEIRHLEAETLTGTAGQRYGDGWIFNLPGEMTIPLALAQAGQYRIRVSASAHQILPDLALMDVRVDGASVKVFEVAAAEGAPAVHDVTVDIGAGAHNVTVAFVNDLFFPELGEDRNLIVDSIEVAGPLGTGTNPIRDRVATCTPDPASPDACLAEIARSFARRAWRRPVGDAEVAALVAGSKVAFAQGEGVDRAIEVLVATVLTSPFFIFRFEIDPDPESAQARRLDGHELASRLSYFLWSSMPDDELFDLADSGALTNPVEIARQVDRMLADRKADALVDNFAGQWINLRRLADHAPDPSLFPAYDDGLRASMVEETRLFFKEFLSSERPISGMLDADFTYVDARLAQHYGIPFPGGEGFQRVALTGPRRGLLGQASVLTGTSSPNRTSPVKRGKWVLENLMCDEPDPPPPGVDGLDDPDIPMGSIRDRMAQHASDPVCRACHAEMDPIGFALEHFDAVGAWRETDGEFAIDATGELPTGERFDGSAELGAVLARDTRLPRCVTGKLLTYAIGRGLEPSDDRTLDAMTDALLQSGGRLRELVHLIAVSDPFLYRRGEPATAGGQP